MSQRNYILHLTQRQLAWIGLERAGNVLTVGSSGVIEGEPAATLEAWAGAHATGAGSVRVYDGRQRYYRFELKLPESARRSYADAVALRIRQELGLDRAAVAWATRAQRAEGELNALSTIVGRRDLLTDYTAWRERHGLRALWIGADVEAIATLARKQAEGKPLLIVNADGSAATLFAVSADGDVTKAHLEDEDSEAGGLPGGIEPHGAALLVRGGGAAALLAGRVAALAALKPLELHAAQNGHAAALRLAGDVPEGLDAVLAGGLLELQYAPRERAKHGVGPAMGSLLDEPRGLQITATGPVARAQERINPARLAPIAVIAVAALLLIGTYVFRARSAALEKLSAHAQGLVAPGATLRAQQGVLEQIKRERSSVMPLFQLLHEATPQGLKIGRVNLASNGALRIEGTTQNRAQIVEFTNKLQSPLLANVQCPEDQAEPQNKFRFVITADVVKRKNK